MGNNRSRARGGYDSSDSDRPCDCLSWDDLDGDCTCKERRRSPPRKKPEVELKYLKTEEEEEFGDTECNRVTYWFYRDYGSSLQIKYCDWDISEFEESNVHKEIGCERSAVYTAGNYNQFQFYFTLDRYETEEDTYFGVYVNILSNIKSEAVVNFKSFLVNSRSEKLLLCPPRKQKFPRKPGFRFLGSICKSAIIIHDEDCYSDRYVPDNNLCLRFKINVQYKKPQSFESFKELLKKNKKKDVTLIVGGQEFPANRKILATRSPVFSKLLDSNTKAKKITIDRIEPEVMNQLLLYIYTNRVTKLFTYTDKLLAAATKYKLPELKALCKKVQPLKGLSPGKE